MWLMWTAERNLLQCGNRTKIEVISLSNMPPLFALLGLLLCLIAAGAEELLVIKDSEAVRYVGKQVEVRGYVVSVTASPLGTAFINFGAEYPNQTFAGFIAAGSQVATDPRIAMLQGKFIGIRGTIELREGKPEIEVVSPDQIKGLDSLLTH
jgi:DNA/RNA endonuclease YhcR with UshA esterase domain